MKSKPLFEVQKNKSRFDLILLRNLLNMVRWKKRNNLNPIKVSTLSYVAYNASG